MTTSQQQQNVNNDMTVSAGVGCTVDFRSLHHRNSDYTFPFRSFAQFQSFIIMILQLSIHRDFIVGEWCVLTAQTTHRQAQRV